VGPKTHTIKFGNQAVRRPSFLGWAFGHDFGLASMQAVTLVGRGKRSLAA